MLSFIDTAVARRFRKKWSRAEKSLNEIDLSSLHELHAEATQTQARLDSFIKKAKERLFAPELGSSADIFPEDADWAWRPEAWRWPWDRVGFVSAKNGQRASDEVTLFHDCPLAELTLSQHRNRRGGDISPYRVELGIFGFEGDFLSLVIDLENKALHGLSKEHIFRLECDLKQEGEAKVMTRLNVRCGPNVERVVREVDLTDALYCVEFDLAYTELNEDRVEAAWLDIIFSNPAMNRIVLSDLTLSRRYRSPL